MLYPYIGVKVSACFSTLRLTAAGRQNTTVDILMQLGYNFVLGPVTLTERVTECGAIMSQSCKLVNSGDFIEVVTPQFEVKLAVTFPALIFALKFRCNMESC